MGPVTPSARLQGVGWDGTPEAPGCCCGCVAVKETLATPPVISHVFFQGKWSSHECFFGWGELDSSRSAEDFFLGSETKVFSPAHLKLQNHGIFVSFPARTILSI